MIVEKAQVVAVQEVIPAQARVLDISEIAHREEMVQVEASICICSCWF